ncbi:hypothetical protein ACGF12_25120 [Kitasatospora sp. NPDC048296]|uniref:hypothetical protein n=1 Tax=Kitasatospora sp. NPDC048296 TaxID=3364048 RepID=UPI00371FB684
MLDEILGVVTAALLPTGSGERTQQHPEAFEDGRVLVFEGCVIGARPYCRPEAAFLHVSLTALAISPVRETSALARYLPRGGLELVEVRRWREGDPGAIKKYWDVMECRDGEDVVLIGCHLGATGFIREALQLDAV